MKTLTFFLFGVLALEPAAMAAGRGGGARISRPSGGGISRPAISKPSSASFRPANVQRPSAPAISKPSFSQPSGGGSRLPDLKPASRPALNPQRPSGSGNALPSFGGGGSGQAKLPDRPSTLPARPGGDTRPSLPGGRPGGGDFLDLKPDRPNVPTRPGQGGGGQQWRPGGGGFDPDRRPGLPDRPVRPNRPDKWQNIHDNNVNQWNSWRQNNRVDINNFQINRTNNWNNLNQRYNERGWAGRFGSDDYWKWRGDVLDFRRDRCEEIWDRREDFWDDCFDDHWWGSCWWRPAPYVHVEVSPWWWWQPVVYAGATAFFGATIAPEPVVYDPGTTVIYEGDTYYIDGQAASSATDARQAAAQLATPAVEQFPVPDPAAPGQPENWLPLGVWALTQQEQGDAIMFMQISVNKDGLVGGAYKNVMTGDEQPIVGQLDRKTQRVAWHIGNTTQTVYETGLSGLQGDVASVFVHFGQAQTQTWLLVRLPSPEVPPGTVKLPEFKKP